MASPFSILPQETHNHIWDMLSKEEDHTNLLHTNSQLRSDILDRLPHRRVRCNCRLGKPAPAPDEKHDCERIDIDKLCVFVDSEFIRDSAMRIQATWAVDEGPEKQGIRHRTAALLVLLAKVCDAAEVVDRLGDYTGSFGIHFSETRKADGQPGTPFWERDEVLPWAMNAQKPIRFYDCIMFPLLYGTSRGPYDAKVTFEHPPKTRGLLFKNTPRTSGQEELDWSIVEGIHMLGVYKDGYHHREFWVSSSACNEKTLRRYPDIQMEEFMDKSVEGRPAQS
ncbi:hypothetical protein COL940_002810 [Colletotrichum noveboracense]|nr:hypothetical protein COL940_002810 [Colletotrichum noveboracense]